MLQIYLQILQVSYSTRLVVLKNIYHELMCLNWQMFLSCLQFWSLVPFCTPLLHYLLHHHPLPPHKFFFRGIIKDILPWKHESRFEKVRNVMALKSIYQSTKKIGVLWVPNYFLIVLLGTNLYNWCRWASPHMIDHPHHRTQLVNVTW